MKIREIIQMMETWAPPALQESYDNAGLLTGDKNQEAKGALITLDVTEPVVEDAIAQNCNLIVAHHPIIFGGLNSLTGKNYVERTVIKALKNDIAIYAAHTNLDNVQSGVNAKICEILGIRSARILSPKKGRLKKLYTFAPLADADKVRDGLFAAGAGDIGEYGECSFNVKGEGTFKGSENTDPYVGEKGKRHHEAETKIEVIFPDWLQGRVISALMSAHPYEEVAYDIVSLDNDYQDIGSGMIGELTQEMSEQEFLSHVKKLMEVDTIRYTPVGDRNISKVAVCGGSGSFLLSVAKSLGADAFVTADFKYHQFFDAEGEILIADIGHFESEQFTKDLIYEKFRQKFPNFAVHLTNVDTNPVKYYN